MNRITKVQSFVSLMRSVTFIVPVFLTLIIAVSEMATAIYAPCLPMVSSFFGITESQVQGSMSINIFGLALSGLFYGPLSDAYGRRYALRLGMGLFFLGSLGCLFATTFNMLMFFRFIQGIGAGVSVVVSFAVVQDLFDEKGTAIVLSFMGMAIALSPGLAPIVGGILASIYGWRIGFALVAFAAFLIILLLMTSMPETLDKKNRTCFSPKAVLFAYLKGVKNKSFMISSLIPGVMIGGLWVWLTMAPVLFINYLNVPMEEYGFYGFFGVLMYILGTVINGYLLRFNSLSIVLLKGIILCLISSVLLILAGLINLETPIMLQGIESFFAIGLAFIIPNGTALAFSKITEGQGTCSALLGSIEMLLGAFCIDLIGKCFSGTIISIGILMAITSSIALGLWSQVKR